MEKEHIEAKWENYANRKIVDVSLFDFFSESISLSDLMKWGWGREIIFGIFLDFQKDFIKILLENWPPCHYT